MQPLAALTASVLDDVVRDAAQGAADAIKLTFLLRRYVVTDAPELRDALGGALAIALDSHRSLDTIVSRAASLTLFTEAFALSDDDRLGSAAADLAARLLADVMTTALVDAASRAIEACLRASHLARDVDLLPAAVDRLEHVIGHAYRPGEGVSHTLHGEDRGGLADQFAAAAALLTAFEMTGRLPYAMLAEELVQTSRRTAWDDDAGAFAAPDADALDVNCDAVRVLCRLGALHRDGEYRAAAVVAHDADYRADSSRILERFAVDAAAQGGGAALYGLALAEYMKLQ